MSNFKVGQRVEVGVERRKGTIRYVGETSFKEGEWIGLELDYPDGKNDGSVKGERYFDCPPNHGLFMQASSTIHILEQPKPAAPKANGNGKAVATTPKARPSSVTSAGAATARTRQSISAVPGKRASLAPPPPSAAPGTSSARRQTMAPPSSTISRASRQSLTPRSLSPKKPTVSASRQSMVGTSLTGAQPPNRSPARTPNPEPSRVLSPGSSDSAGKSTRTTTTAGPSMAAATRAAAALQSTEKQEMEAKIRALEKKIVGSRDNNRELAPLQEQLRQYEATLPKLQNKIKALSKENAELKEAYKQSETQFGHIEGIQAEHESMMEMAELDREMAEEKAESFKAELDAIKSRLEELELENEILKGENEELAKDMSPEERSSQGWLQMQRENDRLREALLRLRDYSQEQESDLRAEIETLEEDSQELVKLKEEYDSTKKHYLEAKAEVEDLKEQLDAALGAETMIEQLTERNMSMSEQIEELRNTVEDLESLKELNDELEINHVEHAKQLQEVIDLKDAAVSEQTRRASQLDEELVDRDYTISRFRELVTNMQSDLQDMRASKQITENEAQALGSHSRTMMDLNRQLQASATSTRVKTIEMEIGKMEAQEASEHLAIVQLFLPEAFHSERDSVLALLRFKRIGFKARLLHGFMKERVTSQGPHSQGHHLLAACDALDKLTWISAMCERFTNSISGSSLEQFAKFESSLYELEPVERNLNGYITNLRKDELREQQVADGLQRSIAVMTHLSELHLRDGIESYAEEILMKTLLMQSNLETTAAALLMTKQGILKVIPPSEDSDDEISVFADRAEAIIMQSRSAKVIAGKIARSLQELKARNLALTDETKPSFEACLIATESLASSLRSLGLSIHNGIHEEGRASPFGLSDLLSVVRDFNTSQYDATDADVLAPLQARMKNLHERLSDIYSVASDLSMTEEFERPQPPWVIRSKELADSTSISATAKQEIAILKREVYERATALKLRDQTLEESSVKIELLEARMRDVSKKANKITELENAVEEAKTLERKMERKLEEKIRLNAKLEEERDRFMQKAQEIKIRDSTSANSQRSGIDLVGTSAEMEALKRDIKVLESTVSFLRQQTRRKKAEEDAMQNSWLQQPLFHSAKESAESLEKRQESIKALEKLAQLPQMVKPLVLEGPGERTERLRWKPRKETPQYRLCQLEMQWLETWEPGMLATKESWLGGGKSIAVR